MFMKWPYFFLSFVFRFSATFARCTTSASPDGLCYWMTNSLANSHADAVRMCAQTGGRLAAIHSREVKDFLRGHLNFGSSR